METAGMDNGTYQLLIARLSRVSARLLAMQTAAAFLYALAAAAVFSLVLAFAESLFYFSPPVKAALFLLLWAAPLTLFLTLVAVSLARKPGPEQAARLVEQAFPALGDRLISAVQLGKAGSRFPGQSPELVRALTDWAERETASLDLGRAIPWRSLDNPFRAAAVGVMLFLGFTVAFPGPVAGGLYRVFDHARMYARLDSPAIYTVNRTTRIIRGEDFTIPGFVSGGDARDVSLWYRWGAERDWNLKPVSPGRRPGDFTATLEKPRTSFEYYLETPGASTALLAVEVIERPSIVALETDLTYPEYTGLGTVRKSDGDGNIRALAGTGVVLTVRASKPLRRLSLVWGDSSAVACAVAGDSGQVSFPVRESIDYHFELTDTLGIANEHPISYRITCLSDEYPSVSLLSPAADVVLPGSMQLPLIYRAGDDFGISRLELQFQVPFEEQKRVITVPRPSGGAGAAEYLWNLAGLNLLPEDTVPFSLVVYDTDRVNGPKRAESETRTIRLPSITDIFTETQERQDADLEKLRDLSERASEQQRRLDDVAKTLKSGEELDWTDKTALEEMRNNLERMQQDFRDVAKNIDNLADRLSEEDIAAVETLAKLEQISSIMNEIAESDMKEALRQLTQVPVQADPQQMKQFLDQNQVSTEDIQRKLDRLISLLEQAKTIQQFEMAKNILEDLALKQAVLGQKYDLAPQDSSLAREEASLAQEMQKTREMLGAAMDSIRTQFGLDTSQARKSLESNDAAKTMSRAAEQMARSETGNAGESIDEANRQISELLEDMDALASRMTNSNTAEVKRRLFAALNQLIIVSGNQEKLNGAIAEGDPNELAKEQLAILESFEKAEASLAQLGELVAEINPVIEQVTSSSRIMMESAMDALTKSDIGQGANLAGQTLQTLNTSINFLTQLLQESGGSQGGQRGLTGDMMQQLQQIANGQLDLQQQMSQQQMSQLSAEQQKLAQMLSELNQKVQNDPRLQEMLQKLAEEMDDTAGQMKRNEERELVERRQLDIYRRLLDARRSRREQGNADERKSTAARENVSLGAESLVQGLGEREQELNRRLEEALEGDFDPAYKRIIRNYFESLLRDRGVSE